MISLIFRRVGQFALLIFLVTSASFFLSRLIPGDFFTRHLLEPGMSQDAIEQLRHRYGLDQPAYVQYMHWLRNAIRLDLGYSLFYGRPVASVVGDAIVKTAWIGIPALILGGLGGVFAGFLHGICSRRWVSRLVDTFSTLALSVPTLVLGLAALILAARTRWFPLGSLTSAGSGDLTFWQFIVDRLHHLILPVVCLAVPIFASVERIQATASRSCLGQLWVRSAQARGLTGGTVFFSHLLRPSLTSVLSVSGPLLGAVLSGSLVLEILFSWPGLGRILYDAVFNNDLHLLVASAAAGTLLIAAGNLAADLLLFVLDPRTRTSPEGGSR
jgi:peptide/nickel transport system permease protein